MIIYSTPPSVDIGMITVHKDGIYNIESVGRIIVNSPVNLNLVFSLYKGKEGIHKDYQLPGIYFDFNADKIGSVFWGYKNEVLRDSAYKLIINLPMFCEILVE